MAYQVTPMMPITLVVFTFSVLLAAHSAVQYHRRGHSGELLAFLFLAIAIALWVIVDFFIEVTTSVELMDFGLRFTNAITGPIFIYSTLVFALAYSDNDQWVNRWLGGIGVGHLVVGSLVFFLFPEIMYEVEGTTTLGPVTILGVTFEEWVTVERTLKWPFLVFQLYIYLVTLGSAFILARYMLRNRSELYTGQAAALAVGIGTPLITNSLVFAGVVPPAVNPTSIAFGVTAVAFAVAIFRYRLLRITPIGRKQVVDQMNDPVVMVDDSGRVVDSNPAARQLVDVPDGWRGVPAEEFFSPFPAQVERFRGEPAVETEITLETDGETRHYDLDISPIEATASEPHGQLIVLRDITEQNERRRELERQNERLDQFASFVSHDLRNPLGIAETYLDFAEKSGDEEDFEVVRESHDRMHTMIENLLTMARAETIVEETGPVDLPAFARETWQTAQTDGATLDVDIPDGTTIEADRELFRNVFENLFRNAVDHNDPPLTVRVGIPDSDLPTDGGSSGFCIEDDGSGIPEPRRDEIFDQGYTTSDEGTGLGLSIVHDVVEAHGWQIQVTESSDGGARFEITGVEISQ